MSLSRGSRSTKSTKSRNIELTSIISFIKFIRCMAFGLLGLAILGVALIRNNTGAQVIYAMVIIVNLIMIIGAGIVIRFLSIRNNKGR